MEELDFGDVVDLIRKEDPRYEKRAYFFLRDALDHTVKQVRKTEAKSGQKRGSSHVTGPELLEGIREYAVTQFGPMTHLVFQQWGIGRCGDFGEMVYQLIKAGVFSKTDGDRQEDFSEVYDFGEVFVKPFLPRRRRNIVSEVANTETF
ncbi:MAG: Minf_1886 family protein [Opitutaceae bacterium]